MDKDFLYKLVEHGVCQRVKILVLINESAVLTLVSDTLRAIAEYSRNDRKEFIHTVQETQVAQQSADISKKRRRLAAAQKRAGELENDHYGDFFRKNLQKNNIEDKFAVPLPWPAQWHEESFRDLEPNSPL